eukprot:2555573-Prymnesium_polylepis.1
MTLGLDKPEPAVPSPLTTLMAPASLHGPVSEPSPPVNCSVYLHARAYSHRMSTRAMLCTVPRSTDSHCGSAAVDSHRLFSLPSKASDEVPASWRSQTHGKDRLCEICSGGIATVCTGGGRSPVAMRAPVEDDEAQAPPLQA